MNEPRWLLSAIVSVIHDMQLFEHGGEPGVRYQGGLESALVRPQNLFHYSGITDRYVLATAYALGITRNHPFVDGNKRVAWLAASIFLEENDISVSIAEEQAVLLMLEAATNTSISDEEFGQQLRAANQQA